MCAAVTARLLRPRLIMRDAFFFFNDTATTEIYTLSLHDALPISPSPRRCARPIRRAPTGRSRCGMRSWPTRRTRPPAGAPRSEEHTSELQSQSNLVCRLLLEKKKPTATTLHPTSTPALFGVGSAG